MKTEESPMPNGVDELFCPPDGAIQFHLIPNGVSDTGSVAQWTDLDRECIWVLPPRRGKSGCGCELNYPVIRESLSERMRNLFDKSPSHLTVTVCVCHGEVIE